MPNKDQGFILTIFGGVAFAWLIAILVFSMGAMGGAAEVDTFATTAPAAGKKFDTLKSALAVTSVTNNALVVVMSGENCSWCVKQIKEIENAKKLEFDWVVIKAKNAPKGWRDGNAIPQLRFITTVEGARVGVTYRGYKAVTKINNIITGN